MPGIIVFRRRWSIGSDDLVVPGISLFTIHSIWIIALVAILGLGGSGHDHATVSNGTNSYSDPGDGVSGSLNISSDPVYCHDGLQQLLIIHVLLLVINSILEASIATVALKGTIWNTQPRSSMEYILYGRALVLVTEIVWTLLSVAWLYSHYFTCPVETAKEALLGLVICNLCVTLSVFMTMWCTFDRAGRSWVKMKRFQRSLKDGESKFHYKRSGGNRPNWRHRKVMRTYQDTWNHRCRLLFCCMSRSDQYQDSFSEIARLLTEFFRDLDLVPTDVVAGLILLRHEQRKQREALAKQNKEGIYEFLSGVAVTSKTRFVSLTAPTQVAAFKLTAHYMKYALAAYGWPMFIVANSFTAVCRLCANLRCCCATSDSDLPIVIGDTCGGCHMAAIQQTIGSGDFEIIYASFHVDVAETPFFMAIDYDNKSIVICIRGTISMKDVITDLHAEAEPLPLQPPKEDWLGHKGMVQAATYICTKLHQENLLLRAFSHNPDRGTADFQLVLVGHSLGAGTAAIAALLLRNEYPNLHCYAYSPPGGLLSLPAAEYSKSFVTSVVVGKDVVPRLGLHQLETLRSNLVKVIKTSTVPKWKLLGTSMLCCRTAKNQVAEVEEGTESCREATLQGSITNQSDPNISLPTHSPLYPPGQIIHIVRQHSRLPQSSSGNRWKGRHLRKSPVHQALWADNKDFGEVLISPVMLQDHMPENVLEALNQVLLVTGPEKPRRTNMADPKDGPNGEGLRLLSPGSCSRRPNCEESLLGSFLASPETFSSSSSPYSLSVRSKKGREQGLAQRKSPVPSCTSLGSELTEGSSIYCLSPMSSVHNFGPNLKREILRLYHKAAADISEDSNDLATPAFSSSSDHQEAISFPVQAQSSIFGDDHGSIGNGSSPVQRPATANGSLNDVTKLRMVRTPLNTSL